MLKKNGSVSCDVLIIGGGISGLVAGYELKKIVPSLKVLVCEANNRLGGRTLTVPVNAATPSGQAQFDLGGQWVGRLQKDMLELMEELKLEKYEQHTKGRKVCWLFGDKPFYYNLDMPFYNPLVYIEAWWFTRKIHNLAEKIDIEQPFLGPNADLARQLDSMTLENFIRENIRNASLRELVRIGMKSVFGMEAYQMSALYVLLYGKGSGDIMNVFEATKDGCQRYRIVGGAQQVSERLADAIGRDFVKVSTVVTSLELLKEASLVRSTLSDGTTVEARHVVLAIPPQQRLKIQMTPSLPPSHIEAYRNMPMGNLQKFLVTYKKAFWRDAGLSGELVCFGGTHPTMCTGPVCITYDACLYDGTPALVGFIGAEQTVIWRDQSREERRKAVLSVLSRCFGKEADNPVEYVEKDWSEESFIGGCPVSIVQPGVGRFMMPAWRQPVMEGRVHLAGTESAQHSTGFMSGAVQAGRRAATETLIALNKEGVITQQLKLDNELISKTCFGQSGIKWSKSPAWPKVGQDVDRLSCCSGSAFFWMIIFAIAAAIYAAMFMRV